MMDNDDQEGDERTSPSGSSRRTARDFDQSVANKVDTAGKKRDFSHIVHSEIPFPSEIGAPKTKGDNGNQDQKGEAYPSANKDFVEAATRTQKPQAAGALAAGGYAGAPNDTSAATGARSSDDSGSTLERSRAMSRIYSQRNRDKQKRQIQDLTEAKIQLDRENASLRMIQQDFASRLTAAKAEGEMLKRQMLTNRVANAMTSAFLPSRGPTQPQQQQPSYLNARLSNNDALLAAAAAGYQIDNSFLNNLTSTLAQQQQLPGRPAQGILPLHQEITALDTGGRRLSAIGTGTTNEEWKDPSSTSTNNSTLLEEQQQQQLNPLLNLSASNQQPTSMTGGIASTMSAFMPGLLSQAPSTNENPQHAGGSLLGTAISEMQRQSSGGRSHERIMPPGRDESERRKRAPK